MYPYWLLYSYFALGTLFQGRRRVRGVSPMLSIGVLLTGLMIGLRYEVGGDWEPYAFMFAYVDLHDFATSVSVGDPAYQALNWIVAQQGGDIWLVNLICGTIFMWGLLRFASVQSDPWLAVLVAVPYLILVVAMGYTRQSVAIGFVLAGLASLARTKSIIRYTFYVFAAALFHRTAVVALPLVLFAAGRSRLVSVIIGIAATALLYDVFLADSMEDFVKGYIDTEYSSQGAAIRILMSLVPATIFLGVRTKFQFPPVENRVWINFSLAAFALLIALVATPSSTAVDRLALYILPLQIAILARLPQLFRNVNFARALVVAYAGAIQFVWLNFAVHADAWIPYRVYPF